MRKSDINKLAEKIITATMENSENVSKPHSAEIIKHSKNYSKLLDNSNFPH